jgi:hypothetical protein
MDGINPREGEIFYCTARWTSEECNVTSQVPGGRLELPVSRWRELEQSLMMRCASIRHHQTAALNIAQHQALLGIGLSIKDSATPLVHRHIPVEHTRVVFCLSIT